MTTVGILLSLGLVGLWSVVGGTHSVVYAHNKDQKEEEEEVVVMASTATTTSSCSKHCLLSV